jgi:hypothetical protein
MPLPPLVLVGQPVAFFTFLKTLPRDFVRLGLALVVSL